MVDLDANSRWIDCGRNLCYFQRCELRRNEWTRRAQGYGKERMLEVVNDSLNVVNDRRQHVVRDRRRWHRYGTVDRGRSRRQ